MLPPLPNIAIEVVDDASTAPVGGEGFLRLRRPRVRVRFADGSASEPFVYDLVDRTRMDAVVVAAHFRAEDGRRHVFLRTAVRPPVALRPMECRPMPEKPTLGNLWELPAGLVEVDEQSPGGLRRCAARELFEEVGLEVPPEAMRELGPSTFPAPGVVGERHFFFHTEVDPARRVEPAEDGSALERNALVTAIPLEAALELARAGALEDAKTELGLRRLAELP
jgi:ADP-ribose pyrophosphatase